MNLVLASRSSLSSYGILAFLSSDKFLAVSSALLLHLSVVALLLFGWQHHEPIPPTISSVKLTLVMQQPVVVPIEMPEVVQEKPEQKPPVVVEPKPIKKERPKPVVKEAKFAQKRVEKKPEPKIEKVIEKKLVKKEPPLISKPEVPNRALASKQAPSQLVSKSKTDVSPPVNKEFDASQYFPVEKTPPSYPRRALKNGVQGSCTVSYTVNKEGRVESPKALSDCHAFFINPSIRATKGFRYTPRIVNGKAVSVPNVKNTFQYRIEEG